MALLDDLICELANSESGIGFIYDALDHVSRDLQLSDAILILETAETGLQIFRDRRKKLAEDSIPGGILEAPIGLHTEPPGAGDQIEPLLVKLCSVAIELDRAKHDASHDSLTGLLNRRSFDILLDQHCSQSTRYGWQFALVLVDVDDFKDINDSLGHIAGDGVLKTIGAALSSTLRSGDSAARVGGDEFALVLANATSQGALQAVARLKDTIALANVGVSVSTGVALAPEEGDSPEAIFKIADERLYKEKEDQSIERN